MICSLKQPGIALSSSDVVLRRRQSNPFQSSLLLPSIPKERAQRSLVPLHKPLHLSSTAKNFSSVSLASEKPRRNSIRCEAYEADRSEIEARTPSEAAKKLKIGIYFATWWALNVVFNIYNKKVLNAYPYPWLTSTLSLACGSLMMLISWATRIVEAPKTDFEFWKTLFPVRFNGFCLFPEKN